MNRLYNIFKNLKTEADFEELITITFTPKEQEMILERWRILEAIDKGLSQRDAAQEVNCSVVTVTRGAKAYREKKDSIQKWLKYFKKTSSNKEHK